MPASLHEKALRAAYAALINSLVSSPKFVQLLIDVGLPAALAAYGKTATQPKKTSPTRKLVRVRSHRRTGASDPVPAEPVSAEPVSVEPVSIPRRVFREKAASKEKKRGEPLSDAADKTANTEPTTGPVMPEEVRAAFVKWMDVSRDERLLKFFPALKLDPDNDDTDDDTDTGDNEDVADAQQPPFVAPSASTSPLIVEPRLDVTVAEAVDGKRQEDATSADDLMDTTPGGDATPSAVQASNPHNAVPTSSNIVPVNNATAPAPLPAVPASQDVVMSDVKVAMAIPPPTPLAVPASRDVVMSEVKAPVVILPVVTPTPVKHKDTDMSDAPATTPAAATPPSFLSNLLSSIASTPLPTTLPTFPSTPQPSVNDCDMADAPTVAPAPSSSQVPVLPQLQPVREEDEVEDGSVAPAASVAPAMPTSLPPVVALPAPLSAPAPAPVPVPAQPAPLSAAQQLANGIARASNKRSREDDTSSSNKRSRVPGSYLASRPAPPSVLVSRPVFQNAAHESAWNAKEAMRKFAIRYRELNDGSYFDIPEKDCNPVFGTWMGWCHNDVGKFLHHLMPSIEAFEFGFPGRYRAFVMWGRYLHMVKTVQPRKGDHQHVFDNVRRSALGKIIEVMVHQNLAMLHKGDRFLKIETMITAAKDAEFALYERTAHGGGSPEYKTKTAACAKNWNGRRFQDFFDNTCGPAPLATSFPNRKRSFDEHLGPARTPFLPSKWPPIDDLRTKTAQHQYNSLLENGNPWDRPQTHSLLR
ncbi:hypothetical protein P280DRAFT_482672 [Massarina eburnea CBS 473.64]|uniref:Uncharacterized protein n=1 Tax=Massarina eburnea CBS 473.64 TaxID=1395130 RepID=A0A6A6RU35_9PLEO|nr:hypothetical protein P280DRAFT_482672 [Massarina eburnea CBS 473.64]